MKLNSRLSCALAVVILLLIFPTECSMEFSIATDLGIQKNPVIHLNNVIWQERANDENKIRGWDIYCYNLFTKERIQISTNLDDVYPPAVYGGYIVWTDERNGNKDIYYYDLLKKKGFQITTNPSDQYSPAIYGDIVVWTDERNGNKDIYGYNICTKDEIRITTDPSSQENPAIYGDIVVWEDYRNGSGNIYGKKSFVVNSPSYLPYVILTTIMTSLVLLALLWKEKQRKRPISKEELELKHQRKELIEKKKNFEREHDKGNFAFPEFDKAVKNIDKEIRELDNQISELQKP